MQPHIDPSADVDSTAIIGSGSKIWHLSQVREKAEIGENCVIGRGAYIGPGVKIGSNTKIQNFGYSPLIKFVVSGTLPSLRRNQKLSSGYKSLEDQEHFTI